MAGDKDQRTEKPSARRRREARAEGQLPRSPELLTWVSLLVATFVLPMTVRNGANFLEALMVQQSRIISNPTVPGAVGFLSVALRESVSTLLPLSIAMPVLGIIGNVAQTGFSPSLGKLKPSFKNLDPRKGLKRLASPQAGWEAMKSLLKIGGLSLVAWRVISGAVPLLTGPGTMSITAATGIAAAKAVSATRTVASAGLVVAAVDYGVIRRRIARQMRQTKQEVKEESKSSEGNPLIKGAIRRKQRQMSRMRMMTAIATADAIVVNPTHVAVALRYEQGKGAPRVVAKGVDSLALRIKAEAREHRVPMVEDRALARALYAACPLDREIPMDLYEAVARLLSFVYSLKASGRTVRLDGEPHVPPTALLAGAAAGPPGD